MRRRKLLERSALALAAGAAGVAVPASAEAAPRCTSTRIGTVVRVRDAARVEVAFTGGAPNVVVTTDGFPPGWRLRAGDRVVVTDVVTGVPVAAPLVVRVTGPLHGETGAGPGVVRVADTVVAVRPATVQAGTDAVDAAGTADYEAYYIENRLGLRPDCVALRPRRAPE